MGAGAVTAVSGTGGDRTTIGAAVTGNESATTESAGTAGAVVASSGGVEGVGGGGVRAAGGAAANGAAGERLSAHTPTIDAVITATARTPRATHRARRQKSTGNAQNSHRWVPRSMNLSQRGHWIRVLSLPCGGACCISRWPHLGQTDAIDNAVWPHLGHLMKAMRIGDGRRG